MAEGGEAGGSGLNPARTESEEELAEAQRMRNRKANLLDLWGSTSVRYDQFERNLNSEELQAALERMGNKYRRVAEFGTHLGNQGAEQLRNERAIFELKPKVVPQEPSEAAVFLHLEKQYNELAEGLEQRAEKKYQRALVKVSLCEEALKKSLLKICLRGRPINSKRAAYAVVGEMLTG